MGLARAEISTDELLRESGNQLSKFVFDPTWQEAKSYSEDMTDDNRKALLEKYCLLAAQYCQLTRDEVDKHRKSVSELRSRLADAREREPNALLKLKLILRRNELGSLYLALSAIIEQNHELLRESGNQLSKFLYDPTWQEAKWYSEDMTDDNRKALLEKYCLLAAQYCRLTRDEVDKHRKSVSELRTRLADAREHEPDALVKSKLTLRRNELGSLYQALSAIIQRDLDDRLRALNDENSRKVPALIRHFKTQLSMGKKLNASDRELLKRQLDNPSLAPNYKDDIRQLLGNSENFS